MKMLLIGFLALGSISAFADCSVSLNIYDRDGKLHDDQRLIDTITTTAKKVFKKKDIKIATNSESDYELDVAVSYIAFQFDGNRGVSVDGLATAALRNLQGETFFQSERIKTASSFLFVPARYDRIVAKAVKKALKEINCPKKKN